MRSLKENAALRDVIRQQVEGVVGNGKPQGNSTRPV